MPDMKRNKIMLLFTKNWNFLSKMQ